MQFNLKTAQDYADKGKIEDWVHAYLTTGDWRNTPFSDGLKLQRRWWKAPVKVELDAIIRSCGPEPEMAYRQDIVGWEKRVKSIEAGLDKLEDLPPLIVNYGDGDYIVNDGNHRHEAMRRKGWTHCWVVIWCSSQKDYDAIAY